MTRTDTGPDEESKADPDKESKADPDNGQETDPGLQEAYRDSVEEGRVRLSRNLPGLVATGLVGGIDVGVGVVAYLLVLDATGSKPLAGLAFGVGLIALGLGQSELYDENFLVPVSTVAARQASVWTLLRLWTGTLAANLVGGWLLAAVALTALPGLAGAANDTASTYTELGVGLSSFALAMLGGAAITLMTWMEASAKTEGGRLVALFAIGFVVATGSLGHVVVVALELSAALVGGADFGYASAVALVGWYALANLVGGLGLTALRFLQISANQVGQADDGDARGALDEPDQR